MIDQKIPDIVKEFAEKFVKVPCDCSKGGLIGENEIVCPKCNGTEWVADKEISEYLINALQSVAKLAKEEGQRSVGIIGAYDAIVEQARKEGRELERTEKIKYDKEGWREEIDEAEKRGRELERKELLEKIKELESRGYEANNVLEMIKRDLMFNGKLLQPKDQSTTEQYKCQSYVKDGQVIDCTCGKCF